MDKELFDFLMSEANFTKEHLEAVYNMDKEGKELATRINNIYKNMPNSVCDVAYKQWCSRCPIKRVRQYLDDEVELPCKVVYIILQLLKEGK